MSEKLHDLQTAILPNSQIIQNQWSCKFKVQNIQVRYPMYTINQL